MNSRAFNQPTPARGRTLAYQRYFETQPPERQRELLAAEESYLEARENPHGPHAAAERCFTEIMAGGHAAEDESCLTAEG